MKNPSAFSIKDFRQKKKKNVDHFKIKELTLYNKLALVGFTHLHYILHS